MTLFLVEGRKYSIVKRGVLVVCDEILRRRMEACRWWVRRERDEPRFVTILYIYNSWRVLVTRSGGRRGGAPSDLDDVVRRGPRVV